MFSVGMIMYIFRYVMQSICVKKSKCINKTILIFISKTPVLLLTDLYFTSVMWHISEWNRIFIKKKKNVRQNVRPDLSLKNCESGHMTAEKERCFRGEASYFDKN